MPDAAPSVKMLAVDANTFESIGYVPLTRTLFVKFRNSTSTITFQNVPGFRFDGLASAPRKDAYFKAFIKDRFLEKSVVLPAPTPGQPRMTL
ncbi:MAG: KTSC domain-containing protein [Verrucomicrobia bacterium]|nr:KTSC domain-containing protein [Verrucomicrobiota bacterium]MDE3098124.1 KTSC domain-containing protein [Verrucomicrobiota bacterium]